MQITDIKIRRIYQENRLRALVSLTIDGELAVHDIKVIEGPERLFVAMPSRRDDNGVFRDIAHPITSGARRQMEEQILKAYHDHLETIEHTGPAHDTAAAMTEAPSAYQDQTAGEAGL